MLSYFDFNFTVFELEFCLLVNLFHFLSLLHLLRNKLKSGRKIYPDKIKSAVLLKPMEVGFTH